jgi:guanine deaminase
MEEDKLFLGRAVGLASESIAKGGGPFGAVIVKNKMIISEAHNTVFLSNDPTAHAEVSAIRKAAEALG